MAVGRAGLGSFPNPRYESAHNKENPELVHDEICTELSGGRMLQLDVRVRGVDKVGAGGTTQTLQGRALGGSEPLRTWGPSGHPGVQTVPGIGHLGLQPAAALRLYWRGGTTGATIKF